MRHKFKRENFKSPLTLPFCSIHMLYVNLGLNQMSLIISLLPSRNFIYSASHAHVMVLDQS